jgi:hypothetical protein
MQMRYRRADDLRKKIDGLASKKTLRDIEAGADRIMDEHLGYGIPQSESPIDLAKRLNTYRKPDRSKQYQDASAAALLKSNNHLWWQARLQKQRIWILAMLVGSQWAAIGWLAHELLARLK